MLVCLRFVDDQREITGEAMTIDSAVRWRWIQAGIVAGLILLVILLVPQAVIKSREPARQLQSRKLGRKLRCSVINRQQAVLRSLCSVELWTKFVIHFGMSLAHGIVNYRFVCPDTYAIILGCTACRLERDLLFREGVADCSL